MEGIGTNTPTIDSTNRNQANQLQKMIKIFVMITFVGLFQKASAQSLSTDIQLKVKLAMTEFANFRSSTDVCIYLEEPLRIKPLESKGFGENLLFFKVLMGFDSASNYRFSYNEELVFSYNKINGDLFKLKGFRDNQFDLFFKDLYFTSSDYFKITSQEDLTSLKRFTKKFYIEGLDLRCLYKSLKLKRSKCLRYPLPILD